MLQIAASQYNSFIFIGRYASKVSFSFGVAGYFEVIRILVFGRSQLVVPNSLLIYAVSELLVLVY